MAEGSDWRTPLPDTNTVTITFIHISLAHGTTGFKRRLGGLPLGRTAEELPLRRMSGGLPLGKASGRASSTRRSGGRGCCDGRRENLTPLINKLFDISQSNTVNPELC